MTGRMEQVYDTTCVGDRVSNEASPQVAVYLMGNNSKDWPVDLGLDKLMICSSVFSVKLHRCYSIL